MQRKWRLLAHECFSHAMTTFQPSALLTWLAGFSPRQLIFVIGFFVLFVAIAISGEARKAFWSPTRATNSATPLPAYRLLTVYLLGAVILGGSLIVWVRDTECWPYSPYPMFSSISPRKDFKFTTLRVYGVTQQEPLAEVPLDDNTYIEPFDNASLFEALNIVLNENRLTPGLKDLLQRYEVLRSAKIHNGPPIRGLRLYRVTWYLNDQASNENTPAERVFLGEFYEQSSPSSSAAGEQ